MIVRKRGFISGSPPPPRAATVNSLIRRVKILPRLASRAPFLCLIEAHFEWPDMSKLHGNQRDRTENLITRQLPWPGSRATGSVDAWPDLAASFGSRPTLRTGTRCLSTHV